jgi:hypothetical protein
MKPVVHRGVYTLQDRLDLIADQAYKSLYKPQRRKDGKQYMLRDLALEIVRGTPQHGVEAEDGQLLAVFAWVKHNIEYRLDSHGFDEYRGAGSTINVGAGDCDCHTILNVGLLSGLGFRTGARICSPDNANWHIYTVAGAHPIYNPGIIFPFDTTQPGSYVGWEPPRAMRKYLLQCEFDFETKDGKAVGLRYINKES